MRSLLNLALLVGLCGAAFGQANIYSSWSNFPQSNTFFPIGTFLQNPNNTIGGTGPLASDTVAQGAKALKMNIFFDIDGGSGGAGWPSAFGVDSGVGSSNQFAHIAAQGLFVMPVVDSSGNTSATSVASVQTIASNLGESANLIGYLLGDEPSCATMTGPPTIETLLSNVTGFDSTRPNNWNLTDYIYGHGSCAPTTINSNALRAMNIASYDNYSMVIKFSSGGVTVAGQPIDYLYNTPWSVASFIAAGTANQPIWFYGDDGTDELAGNSGCTGNLCGADNHELRATPEQVNAEMWSGLINGAMGIVEFCHDTTWGAFGCGFDATTAANLTYINTTILSFAPQLNSNVSGVCTMQTGNNYANFSGSCTNGILTMASNTTATSATASEATTTATFVAGASWGTVYRVNTPVVITGCSVGGYNTTTAIQTVSGTSLTVTLGSSGLGAATGCTVTSKVPGSAIVKTSGGTPYLFADPDRNGQSSFTFTLTGFAGYIATVVYDSNAQYDVGNSAVGQTFTLNGSAQFTTTLGANGHNYQPMIFSITNPNAPPAPALGMFAEIQPLGDLR